MNEKIKNKLYLLIFTVTAFVLGWGAWNNYRPQVILASCIDIAERALTVQKRSELFSDTDYAYNKALQDCLRDAGIQ